MVQRKLCRQVKNGMVRKLRSNEVVLKVKNEVLVQ